MTAALCWVSGLSLSNLVSGGFVHLGGVNVSGIAADQTVTEAQARAGVQLAASATLAAEGAQWAGGLSGNVTLDNVLAQMQADQQFKVLPG